jgi:predicted RNA-binding Zn-ribbon protein involved in translation (DUF1610 family)
MYDRVLEATVLHDASEKLPAGAFSARQGIAPMVHHHPKSLCWETNGRKGDFLSPTVEDSIRIRFLKYSDGLEVGQSRQTLFLYDDLGNLEMTPFEQKLDDLIHHLEAIAADPVLDLEREEYKLPVSRVKRFSSRALPELAGHSEDWLRRTFTSVVPSRLLAEVQSDCWATYENVMMVSLCRDIDNYLFRRLRELSHLKGAFDEILALHVDQSIIPVFRERLLKRVGEYFDTKNSSHEDAQSLVKTTRDRLSQLRLKLGSLKKRELFRRVKPRGVTSTIHMTNLLQNHQHYRYLVGLTESLHFEKKKQEAAPDQFEASQQNLMQGVCCYTECCIRESLKSLGYNLRPQTDIYEHKTKAQEVTVRVKHSEIIVEESLRHRTIRFVALPSDPAAFYEECAAKVDTVVIYPSADGAGPQTRSPAQFKAGSRSVFSIPLSPLSLYSEEMVAGILFRWLIGQELKGFPGKIEKVPGIIIQFIEDDPELSSCFEIDGSTVLVFSHPSSELGLLAITDRYEEFCRHKRIAQQAVKKALNEVDIALRALAVIFSCPDCQHLQIPRESQKKGKQFQLWCSNCGSIEWGASNDGNWFIRCDGQSAEGVAFKHYGRFSN